MSEELASAIPEIAKELAVKTYEDVAQPALRSTGGIIELLTRALRATMAPLEIWTLKREYQVKETAKLLEEKLKYLPSEQIQTPESYIAIPALIYISYCMDNHELRDMYANLLASSMNKFVKNGVHPSYVEIIKQLCPDEAKILRHIATEEAIPTISVYYCENSGANVRFVKDFSDVGYLTGCERPFDVCKYMDNLSRLGLIEIPVSSPSMYNPLDDEKSYESLEKHEYIQPYISVNTDTLKSKEITLKLIRNHAIITDYGKGFCLICLNIAQKTTPREQAVISEPGIATEEEVSEMLNEVFGKS